MTSDLPEINRRLMCFLENTAGKPVEWGADDCSTWCAKWVREWRGINLIIPKYGSAEEAEVLIDRAGGLTQLWADVAQAAGISERYGEPELGDVGVIETERFGEVGVLFGGGNVAFWRATNGTRVITPRQKFITKIWSIA